MQIFGFETANACRVNMDAIVVTTFMRKQRYRAACSIDHAALLVASVLLDFLAQHLQIQPFALHRLDIFLERHVGFGTSGEAIRVF